MILISKVRSSASKKIKPDGVNPNSNDIDYCVRKNEGKFYGFRQTVNSSVPDLKEILVIKIFKNYLMKNDHKTTKTNLKFKI